MVYKMHYLKDEKDFEGSDYPVYGVGKLYKTRPEKLMQQYLLGESNMIPFDSQALSPPPLSFFEVGKLYLRKDVGRKAYYTNKKVTTIVNVKHDVAMLCVGSKYYVNDTVYAIFLTQLLEGDTVEVIVSDKSHHLEFFEVIG